MKRDRITIFNKNRNMAQEQPINQNQNLQDQVHMQSRQIEMLTAALQKFRNHDVQNQNREKVLKEIRYMSNFNGASEVTINSFLNSVEYYLSSIIDQDVRKCAVRTIYYEKIQGEAKDSIINLPDPDNWESIKQHLKRRYRPEMEPTEIYRKIGNLRVNTVSELAFSIQNLKYKADELSVYYKDSNYIDLSNIDSYLLNVIKEMSQGTLLERIYEESDLNNVIEIMNKRRYEDSCIRQEFKKQNSNNNANNYNKQNQLKNQNFTQNKNKSNRYSFNNTRNNYNHPNTQFHQRNQNYTNYYNQSLNQNDNYNHTKNNSGHYNHQNTQFNQRNQKHTNQYNHSSNQNDNLNYNRNNSGQFHRPYQMSGNSRVYSGQNRQQQGSFTRQGQMEPMEVDNIQENREIRNESNNMEFFIN